MGCKYFFPICQFCLYWFFYLIVKICKTTENVNKESEATVTVTKLFGLLSRLYFIYECFASM